MRVVFDIVCLFALFAIVFTLEFTAEESKIAETCKKQLNATDEETKVLEDLYAVPKSRREYCLVACYYKGTGEMDSNNKLVYELAMKEIEEIKKKDKKIYDKIDENVKQCISEITPNKDECGTLKLYTECMLKKNKETGVAE